MARLPFEKSEESLPPIDQCHPDKPEEHLTTWNKGHFTNFFNVSKRSLSTLMQALRGTYLNDPTVNPNHVPESKLIRFKDKIKKEQDLLPVLEATVLKVAMQDDSEFDMRQRRPEPGYTTLLQSALIAALVREVRDWRKLNKDTTEPADEGGQSGTSRPPTPPSRLLNSPKSPSQKSETSPPPKLRKLDLNSTSPSPSVQRGFATAASSDFKLLPTTPFCLKDATGNEIDTFSAGMFIDDDEREKLYGKHVSFDKLKEAVNVALEDEGAQECSNSNTLFWWWDHDNNREKALKRWVSLPAAIDAQIRTKGFVEMRVKLKQDDKIVWDDTNDYAKPANTTQQPQTRKASPDHPEKPDSGAKTGAGGTGVGTNKGPGAEKGTNTSTDVGPSKNTGADTETSNGSGTVTNASTETDTGAGTGTGAGPGTNTGADTETGSGISRNTVADTDTGSGTGTNASADTGTGSSTEKVPGANNNSSQRGPIESHRNPLEGFEQYPRLRHRPQRRITRTDDTDEAVGRLKLANFDTRHNKKNSHEGQGQEPESMEATMNRNDKTMSEIVFSSTNAPITQLFQGLWRETCRVWGFPPEIESTDYCLKIPGLSHYMAEAYQLFAAYWMKLEAEGPANCAYLADATGLGKTLMAWLAVKLQHSINACVVQIRKAKASGEAEKPQEERLPRNRHILNKSDSKCRVTEKSAARVPAVCPCEKEINKDIPAMKIHFGATVIVCPATIWGDWLRKICEFVEQPEGQPTVYRVFAVTANFTAAMARQYKGADKLEPRHARLFTVDDEGIPTEFTDRVILVVSSHSVGRIEKTIGKQKFGHIIIDEAHLMKQNEGILQNWLKQQSTHARTFLISATPAEESVDYLNLVVPAMRHLWQWTWNSKAKQSVISKRRNLSAEQEAYAEEYNLQNVKKAGTAAFSLLKSKPGQVHRDDERYLDELRSSGKYDKFIANIGHVSEFQQEVFIKRIPDTKWLNGGPITPMPHHEAKDVHIKYSAEEEKILEDVYSQRRKQLLLKYYAELEEFRNARAKKLKGKKWKEPPKVNFSKWLEKARLARITSSFPVIGRIIRGDTDYKEWSECTFTKELGTEMFEADAPGQPEHPFFQEFGDELVKTSPKLRAIDDMIEEIKQRKEKLNLKKLEKTILGTSLPVCAEIMIWYLKRRKGLHVARLTSDIPTKDRGNVVYRFENGGKVAEEGEERQGDDPDWLVGTVNIMGTGFTMCAAYRAVLLEPDWTNTSERQFRGRIDRVALAQPAPITFSYRLICTNSKVEQDILVRQEDRAKFLEFCLRHIDGGESDEPILISSDEDEANAEGEESEEEESEDGDDDDDAGKDKDSGKE
ncbi:MAG: hypothetical protein M1831_007192 [Alyxoria varia]|nr:MAG: hypothetical protein M1831_007192 [Alyxoria varia]